MSYKQQSVKIKKNEREFNSGNQRSESKHREVKEDRSGRGGDTSPTPPGRGRGEKGGRGRGGLRAGKEDGRFTKKEFNRDGDGVYEDGYRKRNDERKPTSSKSFKNFDNSGREYISSERRYQERGYIEDPRLLRIVKKISREDDHEKRLYYLSQLKDYFLYPDNAKSFSKSPEGVFLALLDIFYERTYKDVQKEAASCLGVAASTLGSHFHKFLEWLFAKISTISHEEVQVLLLSSLHESLQQDYSKKWMDFLPAIMTQCQTILENADSSPLLTAVVDVIIQLGRLNSNCLQNHFRDTVDILVGWHIDCSQHDTVTIYIANALMSLHEFWALDLNFALTLMGQFLEDLEAYTEDLLLGHNSSQTEEDLPSPQECIIKIAALLRVLVTVILSLQDFFTGSRGPPFTNEFITQMMLRIVKCVTSMGEVTSSEAVLTAANTCLAYIIASHSADLTSDSLLGLVQSQIKTPVQKTTHVYCLSLLLLIHKFISEIGTQTSEDLLASLFSPSSLVHQMALSSNEQLQHELLKVYHCVMRFKSVPLLQMAYRFVVGDMERGLNTLVPRLALSQMSNNPFAGVNYTKEEAEKIVMFNVNVLVEIGNAKSNVIAMWALSPTFFELFTQHLLSEDVCSRLVHYPAVQFVLFKAFYSHCSRHAYFVSTSQLIADRNQNLLQSMNSSSGHFTVILQLCSSFFMQTDLNHDTIMLTLALVSDIIQTLKSNAHVYSLQDFTSLVKNMLAMGRHAIPSVVCKVALCLNQLLHNTNQVESDLLTSITNWCCYLISSSDDSVVSAVTEIIQLLPLNVAIRSTESLVPDRTSTLGRLRQEQISMGPSGNFHSHHFRDIMLRVLGHQPLSADDNCWLERLFSSCQRLKTSQMPLNTLGDSMAGLWFWAVWEAAQFCIMAKLRTPLGKPQETFTTIEASVKKLVAEIRENHSTNNERPSDVMLRVHVLLEFMDCLEKLLYNASEGTAQTIVTPPKVVRIFFRTNRATCEEWLSRIRPHLARIAFHSGALGAAMRHSLTALKEMNDAGRFLDSSFDDLLMLAAQSACQLRSVEAVYGLQAWYRKLSNGRKVLWAKALALMAAGRFECAIDELKSVVDQQLKREDEASSEEDDEQTEDQGKCSSYTNPLVLSFALNQMFVCYSELHDWKAAVSWHDSLPPSHEDHLNPRHSLKYLKALSSFESHDFDTASVCLELSPEWDEEPHVPWKPQDILFSTHKHLLRALLLTQNEANSFQYQSSSEVLEALSDCQRSCLHVVQAGCLRWPVVLQADSLLMWHTANSALQIISGGNSVSPLPRWSSKAPPLHTDQAMHHLQLVQLLQLLAVTVPSQLQPPPDFQSEISALHLSIANKARKQSNLKLSEGLLMDETLGCFARVKSCTLTQALQSMHSVRDNFPPVHVMRVERQVAKLLHAQGASFDATESLCQSICHSMHHKQSDECSELTARSLLTLTKWLQADPKLLSRVTDDKMCSLYSELKGVLPSGNVDGLSENETVIERLLRLATEQAPNLPKTWLVFASSCYKWGRKAVDSAIRGDMQLTAAETQEVKSLLPLGTTEADCNEVLSVLRQIHSTRQSEEEDISDQNIHDEGAEATRHQLMTALPALQMSSGTVVDGLIEIWNQAVSRVYQHYRMSAHAYFTYLKIDSEGVSDDGYVTASLRLLRLLVKHAWEVRDVLEAGLASTPTGPWRGIIPQLFSRLSHPEPYVRQSVSELLCRIACEAGHLVVYPAVIGSSTAASKQQVHINSGLLNQYLSQEGSEEKEVEPDGGLGEEDEGDDEEEEDEEKKKSEALLSNCFSAIVGTLSEQNPQMVAEIQMLVNELRRITLLWDELWLGTLNQQQSGITRVLQQLEHEVNKVNNIAGLDNAQKMAIIKQKHLTLLKPTLYAMERLHAITSVSPETPHEKWFQETYGSLINDAINRLKQPKNPGQPSASWTLFKQLHSNLQQRAQKRSSNVLQMSQLSGRLSAMTRTVIAMPGVSATQNQIVTIAAIHNTVQILPTKTKPKKLQLLGSDGKKYSYLFKGLEDLHLDERIMQFLSIVNNMFAKDQCGGQVLYRARHYSVTPLGARSGLIQWVEGATPLFGLYKRWQQRQALAAQNKTPQPANPAAVQIPRPSDLFYAALNPALKDVGMSSSETSRKDWPTSVLRNVLEQLMENTPADLLARELWCSSASSLDWWKVTESYARSTAVMSMIGYIIGLGDRHLDNLLVDLVTGEVVHIDYNVCFEKGRSLRVPEKVPFRMTANIETALGITGVEGMFRMASEHVVKTLRRGRETLLTLLEAFVYDPLVDWTTGSEGGYTGALYGGDPGSASSAVQPVSKRQMEQEINLNMFSIRVAEMKPAWLGNKEEMLLLLPKLQTCVDELLDKANELHAAENELNSAMTLQDYLEVAAEDSNHALYTLQTRYTEHCLVQGMRSEVETLIQEKLDELSQWEENHHFAVQCMQNGHLQKLASGLSPTAGSLLGPACFASVIDFLQGAGQAQTVTQCDLLGHELVAMVHQRANAAHSCLEVLHTYASIVTHLPASYIRNDRTSQWKRMLQELICTFSSSKCENLLVEAQSLHANNTCEMKTQSTFSLHSRLQTALNECRSAIVKMVERRGADSTDTSSLEQHVTESTHALHMFVAESGVPGGVCLLGVVLSALVGLSKRYLMMEEAASSAGDRLVNLTSIEGDWFLDELCSISGNVNQLLGLLQHSALQDSVVSGKETAIAVRVMMSTHSVYIALQDLNINFRSVILPETIKALLSEEPSMLLMLQSLEDILSLTSAPIDSILHQLEVQLRNAILGMKPPEQSETTAALINQMRQEFNALVQSDATDLPPGRMLLMAFTGLFSKLQTDFSAMLEAVTQLKVPEQWKNVDVVQRARSIQMTAFNVHTLNILADIFFLMQLKAVMHVFALCRQTVQSLQDPSSSVEFFDEEHLCQPIRFFIAEYTRKNVIGLPSQSLGYILCQFINSLQVDVTAEIDLRDVGAKSQVNLDDLHKMAVDLKNGSFSAQHFNEASVRVASVEAAWRKLDLAKRLDGHIILLQGSLQRMQGQSTCLLWLHDSVISTSSSKSSILQDLTKRLQLLQAQESALSLTVEKHQQLEANISQRLKWAAGAKPSLNQVLAQFEETLSSNAAILMSENEVCSNIVTLCAAVIHLETLYSCSPKTMAADNAFISLITRCSEACQVQENSTTTLTDCELKLMLQQPIQEDEVLEDWLSRVRTHTLNIIPQLESNIEQLNKEVEAAKSSVQSSVHSVRFLLSNHHRLMTDIKSILRSLVKQEEQKSLSTEHCISDYVVAYKKFSENFTSLLRLIISDDLTETDGAKAKVKDLMASIFSQIRMIFEDLVAYAPPLVIDQDKQKAPSFAKAVKASSVQNELPSHNIVPISLKSQLESAASQSKLSSSRKRTDKVTRDPRTGKAIQERNSYAVGVWRRVKMKLDGRDPDALKRVGVAEQVEFVIQEAKNLDNLSLLYEGWTPWV